MVGNITAPSYGADNTEMRRISACMKGPPQASSFVTERPTCCVGWLISCLNLYNLTLNNPILTRVKAACHVSYELSISLTCFSSTQAKLWMSCRSLFTFPSGDKLDYNLISMKCCPHSLSSNSHESQRVKMC